jgi:ATP-binding cassette subfamily B protein
LIKLLYEGGTVMFGKVFQRKYALTDQGIKNTKRGTLFTVIVNLVVMG